MRLRTTIVWLITGWVAAICLLWAVGWHSAGATRQPRLTYWPAGGLGQPARLSRNCRMLAKRARRRPIWKAPQ